MEVGIEGLRATAASVAAVGSKLLGAVSGVEVRTDIEQTGTVSFTGAGGADHILNSIQRITTNSQKANVAACVRACVRACACAWVPACRVPSIPSDPSPRPSRSKSHAP